MIRAIRFPTALAAILTLCLFAVAEEPVPSNPGARAEYPPRKVVVATIIFGPYGKYPGLDARLKELSGLINQMADRTAQQYPEHGLDLAILPESAATSTTGAAKERAVSLKGKMEDTFGALARKHKSYVLIPLFDLAEEGSVGSFFSNAAVLFDPRGAVVGIYRKRHPVAYVGSSALGRRHHSRQGFSVFDCYFGRLGVQICWDI